MRVAETPQQELDHKKGREVNAKISFHHDDCYLRCREIFDSSSMLIEYYYDWHAGNGEVLQKFHAHYHPKEASDDVRQFDPWHFHVPQNIGDKDGHRVTGIAGYTIHDVLTDQIIPHILRIRRSGK
ncbi:hypothetical protein [Paenibacillus durus]|uniref:hypothetical protein n=1 Tax=Paenibacillus durus TaxID=44251 RepID=UPI000688F166|nr:hypothetical protein [Paenibacillus durus]